MASVAEIVRDLDSNRDVELAHGVSIKAGARDGYFRGTGQLRWEGDHQMVRRELGFWVDASVQNGFEVARRAVELIALLESQRCAQDVLDLGMAA